MANEYDDYFNNRGTAAAASVAALTPEDDPERASQAVQMSADTGVPADSIYHNFDNFTTQHKALLSSDLISDNPHLQRYLTSDPMAAKISGDDIAPLDKAIRAVGPLVNTPGFQKAIDLYTKPSFAAMAGVREGFGDEPVTRFWDEFAKEYPTASLVMDANTVGMLKAGVIGTDTAFRGLNGIIHGLAEGAAQAIRTGGEVTGTAGFLDTDRLARDVAGIIESEAQGLTGRHGVGPPEAVVAETTKSVKTALKAAEPWISAGREPPPGVHPILDKAKAAEAQADAKSLDEAVKAADATATKERSVQHIADALGGPAGDRKIAISADAIARLYGDTLPERDDGLLGWIPNLADRLEETAGSNGYISVPLKDWLANIDPEVHAHLRDDILMRPNGLTVNEAKGISPAESRETDAAMSAAKDLADANKLSEKGQALEEGVDKTAQAEGAGAEDAVASAEKARDENRDALKEANAKLAQAGAPVKDREAIASPVPSVRAAGGLEPLFSLGDRKVKLERLEQELKPGQSLEERAQQIARSVGVSDWEGLSQIQRDGYLKEAHDTTYEPVRGAENFHDFKITDQDGNDIGTINLSVQKDGKQLYVEMIQAGSKEKKFYDPNFLGPSLVRDLLRQLKAEFPNAETITGHRVTGARDKAQSWMQPSSSPVVKFDLGDADTIAAFHDILQPEWMQLQQGVEALVSNGIFTNKHSAAIANAVFEEMKRVAPGADTAVVHAIFHPKSARNVQGVYLDQGFSDPNIPAILVSLESKYPLGTARHEAIHFLRRMGLFRDAEWDALEKAAIEGDWIGKHGIADRYKEYDQSTHLEEAIAEEYRTWRGHDRPAPEGIQAIFEKIKAFFEGLRQRFTGALGRDFNWEDIFQKVSQGEVGRREGEQPHIGEEDIAASIEEMRRAANDNKENLLQKRIDAESDRIDAGMAKSWDQLRQKHERGNELLDEMQAILKGSNFDEFTMARLKKLSDEHDKLFPRDTPPAQTFEGGEPEPLKVPLPFGKGKAIGIPQKMYERYMRLIQQRHEADLAADFQDAKAREQRIQSREWKENRALFRTQVAGEVNSKPNIMLDKLFSERAGDIKIDPMSLTPEGQAAIPKEYMRRTNSIAADDLAGEFGYPSGDEMVKHLSEATQERQQLGLTHREYVKHLIESETDRRMELQYGWLAKNVLEEAKDRALSQNQINILHEEMHLLAEQAGATLPLGKATIEAEVRKGFNATPVGSIDSDLYLKASGRSARAVEEALLKGDFAEAFREKQRQYNAVLQAKWAKEYEKQRKQLDRTAKSVNKVTPENAPERSKIEPEYVNHIQDVLRRVGYTGRRSYANIRENIARQSSKTLRDFVQEKLVESDGYRDIPLPEFLWDPEFRRPVDELTYGEFAGLKGTIDGLVREGRDEARLHREGEVYDKDQILTQMRDQVRSFDKLNIEPGQKPGVARTLTAGTTANETLMNRFDRNDPRGVFNRFVSYPLAAGSNGKERMMRSISAEYRELPEVQNGKKKLASPFQPEVWKYVSFTRTNLLGLLQNMGNRSNWEVTAKGWGADPDALREFVMQNTTKEDWDRAQQLGEIFNKLIREADQRYEHRYGYTIDKIPLEPIDTPHGTYKGWYHPLIPDPLWEPEGKGQKQRVGVYDGNDWGHIATSNGYARTRTGAIYPVDLSFDMVPQRMTQMIHDINLREAVLDVQKIFRDNALRNAITEHYGKEYTDTLMPYLKNVAGRETTPSKLVQITGNFSEWIRQNTITTYVGYNPYTVMKHAPTAFFMSAGDVGLTRMARAYHDIFFTSAPGASLRSMSGLFQNARGWLAYMRDNFEEIARRERNWQETFGNAQSEVYNRPEGIGKVWKFRDWNTYWGSWPVALSDMMSAAPLALASFNKALEEGSSWGEARDIAERSVRRQHGSTAVTNQPLLVQGMGPFHGWMTSVYGFFGTVMQRRLEIAYQVNDLYKLGQEGKLDEMARGLPNLVKNVMVYVVVPTAIEEYVTSLTTQSRDGWLTYLAKAGVRGTAASVLYLRDLAYMATTDHDPSVGLISGPLHDLRNAINDIKQGQYAVNRQHAGKMVQDLLTLTSEATGLVPGAKEMANAARFGIDYVNKQARPKEISDWLRGLTRGQTEKRVEK